MDCKQRLSLGISGLLLTTALPAGAQTSPAADASPNSAAAQASERLSADASGNGGEILVTARRREERAQTVPIALTAITGDQASAPGAIGLTQVAQLAPSLQLTTTNPRQTNINIRGLGATPAFASLGLEYGVGVYIDQVFYSRPTQSAFDLYDAARVEVLRGPQGTLFGKNTTAGAINITTQEPSFTPSMRGELTFGNYRTFQARATGTAPLSDTVAVRLSFSDTVRDRGFQTNARTGERLHDLHSFSARGQILFTPSDALRIRLIGDYSDLNQNCCLGVGSTVRTTRIDGSTLPNNFVIRTSRAGYTPLPVDPARRLVEPNRPFNIKIKTYGGAGILDWDLGPVTLTSVTGWRRLQYRPATDGDLLSLDIFQDAGVNEDQEQFSQEVRLASNGDGTFDYVLGAYYFHQRIDDRFFTIYGPDAALWILGPAVPGGTTPSVAGQAAMTGLFADGTATARTRSYAGFGEVTWHLGERFDLTAGLRYTHEKKDGFFGQVQRGPALTPAEVALGAQAIRDTFAPNIPTFFVESKENNLSGRATASFKIAPDILAYATYARGFKSGGLNLNATAAPKVIEPEKVQNWEAGLKSQFLDRRLTLNLAAYTQTIRNYQSQQIDTRVAQTAYIANVGTVRSRGFELDASARPFEGLSIFGSIAYTDATYRSFTNAPCPVEYLGLKQVCDLSGRRLPGVSRWSFAAGGEYAVAASERNEVYLNADWSRRSSFYTTYNLAADSLVPGYDLVNARIGIRATDRQWDASVFARNLFDKTYATIINPSAFNTGQSTATLGDPATYGVTLRVSL